MRLNSKEYKEAVNACLRYKKDQNTAVEKALDIVSDDARYIFEQLFLLNKTKYQVITSNEGLSERTFERRKRELIYAVHNMLENIDE